MQVCTLLQTTTPAPHYSVFLQAGCPSCRPTNSVKALEARMQKMICGVLAINIYVYDHLLAFYYKAFKIPIMDIKTYNTSD